MLVKIADLKIDNAVQARNTVSWQTIDEYAEDMLRGDKFPPIIVFRDTEGVLWLASGFHRVSAAKKAGLLKIEADVRDGDRVAAILCSTSDNAAHGLRRTNLDKRRAVTMILGDEKWRSWSDQTIADHCKVSRSLVIDIRKQLYDTPPKEKSFINKYGDIVVLPTANIGSKTPPGSWCKKKEELAQDEDHEAVIGNHHCHQVIENGKYMGRWRCDDCFAENSDLTKPCRPKPVDAMEPTAGAVTLPFPRNQENGEDKKTTEPPEMLKAPGQPVTTDVPNPDWAAQKEELCRGIAELTLEREQLKSELSKANSVYDGVYSELTAARAALSGTSSPGWPDPITYCGTPGICHVETIVPPPPPPETPKFWSSSGFIEEITGLKARMLEAGKIDDRYSIAAGWLKMVLKGLEGIGT